MTGLSNTLCALSLLFLAPACGSRGIAPARLALSPAFVGEIAIDEHAGRFVFDTGSQVTLLAQRAVARLGLSVEQREGRSMRLFDSTGELRVIQDFATVGGLRLGSHTFLVERLAVVPFDARLSSDGILGMDVMRCAAWWFDAPFGRATMLDGEQAEKFVTANGHRIAARLALGGEDRRPLVRVRLEGRMLEGRLTVELLLDSGAARTELLKETIAALGLADGDDLDHVQREREAQDLAAALARSGMDASRVRVEVPKQAARVGLHGGVGTPVRLAHLRCLELAGREFRDLVVGDRSGQYGVLGRDVLATFPWLLHGPRRELWVLERTKGQ